ncbi:replication initiation protein [Defluviitalea phaphyphila]|uniref:replication initiation protein n=1 Tax=Defluviitalea phaphyphila TaxID=1473580 RepID=UPI000731D8FD|nr:replication initiation protein [Defluviitalea phaphyphila]
MDNNYWITRSNFFIIDSSYNLTIEEQKVIFTLVSMVQPNDEEFKCYYFKIYNFMKLLGINTKIKYTSTPKIIKNLIKKSI